MKGWIMKGPKLFLKGFADTMPLGIGVSIYGIVYGVLGGKAGLSVWEVAALSAFVFAGASQIAAVQMIALGSSPLSIIFTVFTINLRHFLFAASLAPYMKNISQKMKAFSSFFITDEVYAVTYSYFRSNKPSLPYMLGSGLNIYTFWGAAGVIGYLFGYAIPPQLNYVFDFAFVAAFTGMLVPMIKDASVLVTVAVSAVISVFGALYLHGKWYILIAGVAASFAGFASGGAFGQHEQLDMIRETDEGRAGNE